VKPFALAFGALRPCGDLATDFRLTAPIAGSVTLRRPVWASCRRHFYVDDCEERADGTSGEFSSTLSPNMLSWLPSRRRSVAASSTQPG
jgi:hypothetical protein